MKIPACLVLCALTLSACSRMNEEELFQAAQKAYEQKNYQETVKYLEELVDRFPGGTRAEESLFLLGTIYNDDQHDFGKSVATFRRLRERFPAGTKSPTALFLIGYIYNNQLQKFDSARIAYEEFLKEFPDHEMAPSARFELENLGKSPDEMFKTKIATKQGEKTKPKRKR